MQIEVIKVDVENKGKYRVATVAYKGPEGKIEGKKVMSFGAGKPAFEVLVQAQPGDKFDVKSEKIDGYWNWTAADSAGKATEESRDRGNAHGTKVSPRTTYETPEERAQKQVYIVRQSSISNALALLMHNSPKAPIDTHTVKSVARELVEFVLGQESLQDIEVE